MRIPRQLSSAVLAVALVALAAATASACPTCGAGMSEAGEAGRKMLNGWFWSIIFMMSMPFTILASLGGYMYYLVRKAEHNRAALERSPLGSSPAARNPEHAHPQHVRGATDAIIS
jgi:hypothetical protein